MKMKKIKISKPETFDRLQELWESGKRPELPKNFFSIVRKGQYLSGSTPDEEKKLLSSLWAGEEFPFEFGALLPENWEETLISAGWEKTAGKITYDGGYNLAGRGENWVFTDSKTVEFPMWKSPSRWVDRGNGRGNSFSDSIAPASISDGRFTTLSDESKIEGLRVKDIRIALDLQRR